MLDERLGHDSKALLGGSDDRNHEKAKGFPEGVVWVSNSLIYFFAFSPISTRRRMGFRSDRHGATLSLALGT